MENIEECSKENSFHIVVIREVRNISNRNVPPETTCSTSEMLN